MTKEEAKRYLLSKAKALGVEAELLFQEERELSLRARNGALEEIKEARQRGVGLRVVAEGRVGYAYTKELSPRALEEARENALLSGKTGSLPGGGPWEATTSWARGFPPPSRPRRPRPWPWRAP